MTRTCSTRSHMREREPIGLPRPVEAGDRVEAGRVPWAFGPRGQAQDGPDDERAGNDVVEDLERQHVRDHGPAGPRVAEHRAAQDVQYGSGEGAGGHGFEWLLWCV